MRSARWFAIYVLLVAIGCDRAGAPVVPRIPVIDGVTPTGMLGQPGQQILFTATATNAPLDWSWDFGGGATPRSSTEATPTVTLGAEGHYTGTVTASNATGTSAPLEFQYTVGSFQWVTSWGGPSYDEAQSVAVDNMGNISIVGYFWGTADFNPGGSEGVRTSAGGSDGYLLRLDRDGAFLGVSTWGGKGRDFAPSVAIDNEGNFAIAGYFQERADFNPGGEGGSRTSAGGADAYLLRLGPWGAFQGVSTWGGSYVSDHAWSVAVDGTGNLAVVGEFWGSVDFNPGGEGGTRTSAGDADAYLVRFGPDGAFRGVAAWGAPDEDSAQSVAVDSAGSLAIAGDFNGTIDFNPGGVGGTRTSAGEQDGYLLRLGMDGAFLGINTWGALGNDFSESVIVESAGSAVIAGAFQGMVDFNPGGAGGSRTSAGFYDGFLLRLGPDGAFQGVSTWGGPAGDIAMSVVEDSTGNLAVAGVFWGTSDFDLRGVDGIRTSEGNFDGYVMYLDPSGTFQGIRTWGGPGRDYVHSLAVDSTGSLLIAGFIEETVDFDPGRGVVSRSSAGYRDAYLLKLGPLSE